MNRAHSLSDADNEFNCSTNQIPYWTRMRTIWIAAVYVIIKKYFKWKILKLHESVDSENDSEM